MSQLNPSCLSLSPLTASRPRGCPPSEPRGRAVPPGGNVEVWGVPVAENQVGGKTASQAMLDSSRSGSELLSFRNEVHPRGLSHLPEGSAQRAPSFLIAGPPSAASGEACPQHMLCSELGESQWLGFLGPGCTVSSSYCRFIFTISLSWTRRFRTEQEVGRKPRGGWHPLWHPAFLSSTPQR